MPQQKRRDFGGGDGARKKSKFVQHDHSQANKAIPANTRGIIITCNGGWEKKATMEMTPVIEEFYEKLSKKETDAATEGDKGGSGGGKDIAAMLAAEVQDLKEKAKKRFRWHETGIKGCVYIIFPEEEGPSPCDVVVAILKDHIETQQLRSRHTSRILPVAHSCYASLDEIKLLAEKIVPLEFPTGEGSTGYEFSVEYDHRASANFDRMSVINAFATLIKAPHKVNLSTPQKTIMVQITRNVCTVAVVPQYKGLFKYNLKLASGAEQPQGGNKGGKEKSEAEGVSNGDTKDAAEPAAAQEEGKEQEGKGEEQKEEEASVTNGAAAEEAKGGEGEKGGEEIATAAT